MERIWHKSYDPRVPFSVDYPKVGLPLILEQNAHRYEAHTAVAFMGAQLTYGKLWDQVMRMARAFHDLGVVKESKVAVMLPNCPQAVIAYYAALWLGAVVVMTNPLYVEREMEHQWNDSDAEFLVTLDHLYPRVEKVRPKTGIHKVIVTSIRDYLPFLLQLLYPLKARQKGLFTAVSYDENVLRFRDLLKSSSPQPPPCSVGLDDLALLQYTGGTTGVAKGVMLTHGNILSNVAQIISWIPDIHWGRERFLALLPFSHALGMTVCMNMCLYAGAEAVVLPRFEINELLKTLQKKKVTIFPGVPTLFTAIVNHDDIHSHDLSSIRYCVTGSAPMPVEILKKFESMTGSIIIEGYGLTEASPVTHCNPLVGVRKPGSVGLALPDTDCDIMDMKTGASRVPPGQEGELVIRGPQVMQSYWKMPQETAQALRGGWLYTGDIARMDEDGFVYVVDRKKDMIIAGGYNIYPREIDEVLYEHPKVLDAVAVGIPDEYRGEIVKAYVVRKPGQTLSAEEVIAFCRERLAAYKVPRLVEFRDSLPKTMVGKVLRKELRKEYENLQEQSRSDSPPKA